MALPATTPILTPFNLEIVQVELSSKCVLKCPRCPRTELALPYLNQEISTEDFVRAFTPEVLSQIKYLLFCGHTGDPIYATNLLDVVEYVKSVSDTRIRIVTNGSYKKSDWWQQLGQLLDSDDGITFSIDGWDDQSNNQYRIDSNWTSIVSAIKILKNTSACYVNWSTIYFNFNQDHIERIIAAAKELGCDQMRLIKSAKFGAEYAVDGIDLLQPTRDYVSTDNNYQRGKIVFVREDPFVIEKTQQCHPWAKCLNGAKEINVTVQGHVYPCGWFNTGYNSNSFVEKWQDRINIRSRSLIEILEDPLWSELTNAFNLQICEIKCRSCP